MWYYRNSTKFVRNVGSTPGTSGATFSLIAACLGVWITWQAYGHLTGPGRITLRSPQRSKGVRRPLRSW